MRKRFGEDSPSLVSLSRRVRLLSGEAASAPMMQWNPLGIEGQPDLSALGQGEEARLRDNDLPCSHCPSSEPPNILALIQALLVRPFVSPQTRNSHRSPCKLTSSVTVLQRWRLWRWRILGSDSTWQRFQALQN